MKQGMSIGETSDVKFQELFWREIFHEIFREIFLKYLKKFHHDEAVYFTATK